MDQAFIETPLGVAKLEGNADGLSSITVLNAKEELTDVIPESLEDAVYQLNEYFEGKRKTFDLNLNPNGTDFQQRVWKALQTIAYGKTVSYLELSKTLGDVKAIRAVGAANGKTHYGLWYLVIESLVVMAP